MDVLATIFLIFLNPSNSVAQEYSDFSELDQIEAELERNKIQQKESTNDVMPFERRDQIDESRGEKKNISDLRTLETFDELAIIHPRFQPKSQRFQVNFGGATVLNDPWFNQFGASLRAAYHFTELLGIEIAADMYSGAQSAAAKDLFSELNVAASSFVRPKSYTGVHLYLSPIYGKMSLFNKRIVPYDVFFTLGAGSTQLEQSRQQQAETFHIGAGQIFAFTRNASFRWDVRANVFSAQSNSSLVKTTTQNIIMNLGFSYFFPEVSRR